MLAGDDPPADENSYQPVGDQEDQDEPVENANNQSFQSFDDSPQQQPADIADGRLRELVDEFDDNINSSRRNRQERTASSNRSADVEQRQMCSRHAEDYMRVVSPPCDHPQQQRTQMVLRPRTHREPVAGSSRQMGSSRVVRTSRAVAPKKTNKSPVKSAVTSTLRSIFGGESDTAEVLIAYGDEPTTYEDALSMPDSKQWVGAMDEEYKSLLSNKTWTVTALPPGRKAIKCKWVFKIKRNTDGSIERYKARLVAKGFSQREGIDYKETFSPVVRLDSVRMLLAIVAKDDLEMIHFDVKAAFLHGTTVRLCSG